MSFFKMEKSIFALFDQEKYQEAFVLADQAEKEYPEMRYKTSFWKACLHSITGNVELAVQELRDALDEGIWWSPDRLEKDEDLKALRNREEFLHIVAESKRRFEESKGRSKPEFMVWEPTDKGNFSRLQSAPFILSIHWRGDNIQRFSRFWDSEEVRNKYWIAFPQSSQLYGFNEYCWDDASLAESEIIHSLQKMKESYSVNTERLILAGASQGGKLALELALKPNDIRAKGFILIVPSIRDVEQYHHSIADATAEGVRGCIITGDQDYYYRQALDLHAACERSGLPCKLVVREGLGHFFADDFTTILPEAVEFILDQ
jgi:predicted esterase